MLVFLTLLANVFSSFRTRWQAGKDLVAGLRNVDRQIHDQLNHASQGGPP